jgi:hypothetical protein
MAGLQAAPRARGRQKEERGGVPLAPILSRRAQVPKREVLATNKVVWIQLCQQLRLEQGRDVVLVDRCSAFWTRSCFGGNAGGAAREGTRGGDRAARGSEYAPPPRHPALSRRKDLLQKKSGQFRTDRKGCGAGRQVQRFLDSQLLRWDRRGSPAGATGLRGGLNMHLFLTPPPRPLRRKDPKRNP